MFQGRRTRLFLAELSGVDIDGRSRRGVRLERAVPKFKLRRNRGLCPLDPRRRAAACVSAARRESSVQAMAAGESLGADIDRGTNKMGSGAYGPSGVQGRAPGLIYRCLPTNLPTSFSARPAAGKMRNSGNTCGIPRNGTSTTSVPPRRSCVARRVASSRSTSDSE